MFSVYVVKCLSCKAVHIWVHIFSQASSKAADVMPDQLQKWLRQQSKDFYAVGFDALVTRWDKYINFGGGYVEKYKFSSRFEYHMFNVLYASVIYLLILPRLTAQYSEINTVRLTWA
jgi:hypothetical protein